MSDRKRWMITMVAAVLVLGTAGIVAHLWQPDTGGSVAELLPTEALAPVVTLVERARVTPTARLAMPGATLTPTLYVIASEPTLSPTPTITPTPAPTVDYGREGAIGRIQIPALDIDLVILEAPWHVVVIDGQPVAQWETVDWAAGHNVGSAPIGGPGNTVLTGHTRGNGNGEFQNLWELQGGEPVYVWDSIGREFTYVVESVNKIQEVGATLEQRQKNAQYMMPTDDTRLTLITCWPEWVYTHRIIVIARPQE